MASAHDDHSAISLIRNLLTGDSKDALTNYARCLGRIKTIDGRQCANKTHKMENRAASEYSNLIGKSVSPGDENTFASIVDFLYHRHCHVHQKQALEIFQSWKVKNGFAEPSESEHGEFLNKKPRQDAFLHYNEDRMTDATPSIEMSPMTPQGTPCRATADSVADDFSDLTISPGQESTITLGDISIASTTLTTPDETPETSHEFPMMDEVGCRPGTPTRASRRPTHQIMDQDLEEDPEAREVMAQESAKGVGMKEKLIERMKTQRRGKLPLLIGIEHDWTVKDHDLGRVYIFQHDKQAGLIKIGFTRGNACKRYAQSGNCYAIETTPYWESKDAFVGAYRVEQLVQKQLHEHNMLQHQGRCASCNKLHREWFQYDADKAVELINMWTQFVQDGFYDIGEDAHGNKYGRLSQKGRDFMDGVCRVNVDVLRQLISKESHVCTHVSRAVKDNSSVIERVGPAVDSVVQQMYPVKEIQQEIEDNHFQMDAGGSTASQHREKQGAKYHAKQALTITIHEIREMVPRSLWSFLGRQSTSGSEQSHLKPSEVEMSLQKFIGTFYVNELDNLEQAPESPPKESKKGIKDIKRIYRQLRRKD